MTTRRTSQRGRTATLACGAISEYEAPDLVPAPGDVVPCRRHGHCLVVPPHRERSNGRRSRTELLDHLERRGTVSVRSLRAERFSLRLITEAERAGYVTVDLAAGLVTPRAAARWSVPADHGPPTAA